MTDEQKVILEQYKIFVEMSDRVSTKRGQANMFYISLLSGIIIATSAIIEKKLFADFSTAINISTSVLGIIICFIWRRTIISFRALNTAKFKVIHEMESHLPFACYDKEWEYLNKGKQNKYTQLTASEVYIPLLLTLPFIALLIYSVVSLFAGSQSCCH